MPKNTTYILVNREAMPKLDFQAYSIFHASSYKFGLYTPFTLWTPVTLPPPLPSLYVCASVTLLAITGLPHFTIVPCQ